MSSWNDLAIAKKLYLVIGTMGVLIACELATLRFAMRTLSAVRAFVGGEGTWSKAQKDAALALHRYALTGDESEYQRFLEYLRVPEGDHDARIELQKPRPDLAVVRDGFLRGHIHPDDIDGMIDLLRRFHRVSYLQRAIDSWRRADELLSEFKQAAVRYHELLRAPGRHQSALAALGRIDELNRKLTTVEAEFSAVLGEGSRWLEGLVISLLFLAVLAVECVGLTLTFRTSRAISRGLSEANDAAERIGEGEFSMRLAVRSRDELGRLAESINGMGALLERSYGELEDRVRRRTAELEAMARENQCLYQQADAAVRMRDEFISIASHELRTPIAVLTLQLEMVARQLQRGAAGNHDPDRARMLSSLERTLRQSHRLALLSTELMDLTHIRLGKLELHRSPGDFAALAREVAQPLRADASRAGSALEIDAAETVPGVFDPARLAQVVTNLLTNAIKYGSGQPIRLVVRPAEQDGVRISVQDGGVGIPVAEQERIFERFERGAEAGGRASGLGLGLYITRKIVELHGGRIAVKSRPGSGSTFVVELPGAHAAAC